MDAFLQDYGMHSRNTCCQNLIIAMIKLHGGTWHVLCVRKWLWLAEECPEHLKFSQNHAVPLL